MRQVQINEDSEWWTAALADMDAATVRRWCLVRAADDAEVPWSWWDGVQATDGWEQARRDFIAFADMLQQRQPTEAQGGRRPRRGMWTMARPVWHAR